MGLFDRFKKKAQPAPTVTAPEPCQPEKPQRPSSASKKRKTLPKDFDELLEGRDIDALKAVFDKCALDAYSSYNKQTALAFRGIPDELARWLVDQGADINAKDSYGNTPLHRQSAVWHSNVQLFIDLGADIEAVNNQGETPLHTAACAYIPNHVQTLVANGANINVRNNRGLAPLSLALGQCQNAHISRMAEVTEILLKAGAPITEETRQEVERIGKSFEFARSNFNPDFLEETEAGLESLYEAFDVLPVFKRKVHDGHSPITVTATRWQDQHQELWNLLVPASGHAKTVQGEAIRITGRISDEIYRNGSANWDADYRKMLEALQKFLGSGKALPAEELKETAALVEALCDGTGEEEAARLTELAVKWVLENPEPITMEEPGYKR
ncbi:ankyrin repeat domain-containing protein [Enterococcus sp. 669A]|uniref:Ankyrin repeat domain-containing protein n=1 Tax=Candidatus Enterococcus moelleringii TaxID=2815325 RepID=A0ABS3LIY3_9ENTE|nr:ankyrin repeat domain-containing protein [Enterococcus sp. 669A]MBO1308671.1 ankyrin repeat domain-containing protein [Enterococcus sp. 669A]